jgi:hypothetical protein
MKKCSRNVEGRLHHGLCGREARWGLNGRSFCKVHAQARVLEMMCEGVNIVLTHPLENGECHKTYMMALSITHQGE